MDFQSLLLIGLGAILINNFVLARFLGLCPYLGVSKQIDSAVGMGFAVIFVMGIASAATWALYRYFLDPSPSQLFAIIFRKTPPDLRYLQTITFIVVIAALVQFVEMVVQKTAPGLYRALGIYLPLITTNCAVLGVSFINIDAGYNFLESVVNGIASGLGFMVALVLMAGLREKLDLARVPEAMKGAPIAFIMAGLMSLAFMGFSGLSIGR